MSVCSCSADAVITKQSREGNHQVFCFGLFYLGPDWSSLLVTIVLVVIPTAVYLGLVVPDLGDRLGWSLVAIGASIIFIVFASLYATAFINPGVIKRRHLPQNVLREVARPQQININGHEVTVKFCHTCHIQRPPRCSHCAVCDNCVEKFDHHCPWMGTCIGRRNYRSFLVFVVSTTLACYYILGTSIALLVDIGIDKGTRDAFRQQPGAFIVSVYCFIASFFPLGLAIFHMFLLSSNYTTYEHFKSKMQTTLNPYDRGALRNIYEVCCSQTQLFKYKKDNRDIQNLDIEGQAGEVQMVSLSTSTSKTKTQSSELQKPFSSEISVIVEGQVREVDEKSENASQNELGEIGEYVDNKQPQEIVMDQTLNDADSQSSGGDPEGLTRSQGQTERSQQRQKPLT